MFENYFLWGLCLIWIIFAVVQDLRTREIANWLNYSLIIFALSFRFFYSLFELNSFDFFYQGIFGFILFFILGNILYYGKFFAGGDANLFMALGTILPLHLDFFSNLSVFLIFIFIFLSVGSVYSLLASFYFGIKNFKILKKEYGKQKNKNSKLILVCLISSLIFFISSFFIFNLFYLALFLFISPYFYLYIKSVDESSMVRKVKTLKLTPGDWLYRDVKIGNKIIKSTWDGLTLEEINFLKKNKNWVLVKYGIPFAPVFLISFILFILNLFFNIIII